jgi:dTDP-4-amino-4,6-dideoxygalactose transaminase
MTEVSAAGIPCGSGSCSEIYLEKAFEKHGLRPEKRLPIARELGETSLMFLVHPTLTIEHIEATADVVEQVMHQATR